MLTLIIFNQLAILALGHKQSAVVYYSIVVAAIVIFVAIAAGSDFCDSLSTLLSVVGYWTAAYVGIALAELYCFRKGCYDSYHLSSWNKREELPFGLAAFLSLCFTFGLIVLFMNNAWYTGPIAVIVAILGWRLAFL
jgi:purine-cytosine permease-like protein